VLTYRNEAMDATHLAEFFQVEGVVADYDITLGNLVGMSFSLFYTINLYPTSWYLGSRNFTDDQRSWRNSLRRWETRN
jgi:phenylalanyl-tRNA synthetase alpha chain